MEVVRVARLGGFLVAAFVLVGCDANNNMAEVKGTVTVDGQLVDDGAITFIPQDGKSQTAGDVLKEGKYAKKVPLGVMKVAISAPKVIGKKKLYDTPDSPYAPVRVEGLPAKYSDNLQTELTFEVKPGLNQKDWDLQSK